MNLWSCAIKNNIFISTRVFLSTAVSRLNWNVMQAVYLSNIWLQGYPSMTTKSGRCQPYFCLANILQKAWVAVLPRSMECVLASCREKQHTPPIHTPGLPLSRHNPDLSKIRDWADMMPTWSLLPSCLPSSGYQPTATAGKCTTLVLPLVVSAASSCCCDFVFSAELQSPESEFCSYVSCLPVPERQR